ncbi:MAG: hypothetical protein WD359_03270 [Dehalococcoidia bacterium]
MSDAPQLRTEVRSLLLEFDRSFAPSDRRATDATRHAYRLRFALARVEEQAQAAVMQSPLYTPGRFDIALSILRLDIDRARNFFRSLAPVAVAVQAVGAPAEEEVAQRAA